MREPTDAELVERAARGDRAATDALFRRHWKDAWRLSRSMTRSDATADDAAQDAFVRAIASIRTLRDPTVFRSWLHRIVVNVTLDAVRREARDTPVEAALLDRAGPSADPDGGIAAALELTEGIPPDQRAVLVLRHCLGYSLAETADILKLPVGTVQSRAARGLRELRGRLGGGQ